MPDVSTVTAATAATAHAADTVAQFHEHGYVLLRSFLDDDDLRPAQDELGVLFPTGDEYHGGVDPERNARFAAGAFAGIDLFPYESVVWSLLGLSPKIVALAELLLGTDAIRLYEAHNWAKYGGATEYDQPLHRDFGNHTIVVPSTDGRFAEVEMFIYVHDVPISAGPTYVVSQTHTGHLPLAKLRFPRPDHDDLYVDEIPADGPAGTVLAYKSDTLHRGSAMTDPLGARFVLKSSFRTISDVWFDKIGLSGRLGPSWYEFVRHATPRQLEVAGFPPRGHTYWTSATWKATCERYPAADLTAFAPAPLPPDV